MKTKTRGLISEDFYTLADTLGIELMLNKGNDVNAQFSGKGEVSLRLFDGLDFPVTVTVVDSGVYEAPGYAGVVAHLCGSLYAILLVSAADFSSEYLQMWLVDGSKLPAQAGKPLKVFPRRWDRVEFYSAFVDGVVCGYRHSSTQTPWIVIHEAKNELTHYIARKSVRTDSVISSKYRTIGPRG